MFLNLEQGTQEWMDARRGRITGSRFKDARDRSTGLNEQQTAYVALCRSGKPAVEAATMAGYKKPPTSEAVAKAIKDGVELVWGGEAIRYAKDLARERCGGTAPAKFQSSAMRTGTEQEPVARALYEAHTGHMVDEVGFYATEDGLFGLSPDGLIDDDGVLEIKTMVSSDILFTAIADGDVSAYRDQCLGYLWLLGRKWVDLVLWCPDLHHIVIHHIERDEDAIEYLEADLIAFSGLVKEHEAKLRASLSTSPAIA